MDQKALADLFAKYGEIGSCKLEIYASGESRGFGYVQFQKADFA
jgi:polyadenylate-binding protein